jgi:DNA polymerase-3 subunit delta
MELDYSRILEQGFPAPPAPVYLFVGNDDALKREAVARLIEPLMDPSSSDFDREDLDVGLAPLMDGSWTTRILSSAAGVAMFSERRIVVVSNVQRLGKEEQDALAIALGKALARSCLILIAGTPEYDAGRIKSRSAVTAKLQAAVAKAGTVVTCDVASAGDLKSRATGFLRVVGKAAEPVALDIFVQRAVAVASDRGGSGKGGDLNVLINELEKAIAYTGSRSLITRADALAVGTRGAEENIFVMLDAVGKRDLAGAVAQVDEMLRCGDKPDGVAARSFVMLARHLRLLWGAKYLAERRIGAGSKNALPPDIQSELTAELQGLATRQSYLLRSLQEQAKRWTYAQLRRGLMRILESDLAMKGVPPIKPIGYTGGAGEDSAANLRILVVELCRSGA